MNLCQFLILEASPRCNLGGEHDECPSRDPRRWEGLDTTYHLTEDDMVVLVTRAYKDFGFRGMCGFHYFNEPLLSKDAILRVIARITPHYPQARFVLWTNGTLITAANARVLAVFSRIYVSNYQNRDFSFLKEHVADVEVIPTPQLDARRTAKGQDSDAPCLRPYTEFVVDHHGYVHLCCHAWRGSETLGNVLVDDLRDIVGRFADVRDRVGGAAMGSDAPSCCRTCWRRFDHLTRFVPQVADAAEAHARPEEVLKRRQAREDARISGSVKVPDEEEEFASWLQPKGPWLRGKYAVVASRVPGRRPFRLFAMLRAWNEADIIEAAVRNCYAQGAERVYLVDNGSTDDTIGVARAAGAVAVRRFASEFFQDNLMTRRTREWAGEITEIARAGRLWWWTADADELLSGYDGLTVREFLLTVPAECNAVGAVAFNHYPTQRPANVPGVHPRECQPMGMLWDSPFFCGSRHWKHPLFLVFDGRYTAGVCGGLHDQVVMPEHPPLAEARQTLILHHFMFREERVTRARLKMLCEPKKELGGHSRSAPDDYHLKFEGAIKRYQSLDAVYSGRWDEVIIPHTQGREKKVGVELIAADEALRAYRPFVARW